MTIKLELPYPPTINHYYQRTARGMAIGKAGKLYRENVVADLILNSVPCLVGNLDVQIIAHPPDKQPRDIDNILKALLDALEKGRAFENDNQIKRLSIAMMEPVEDGAIWVSIREMANA